jgi:hypothetical protein
MKTGRDFLEIWPRAQPVVLAVASFVGLIPGLAFAAPRTGWVFQSDSNRRAGAI